MLRRALHTSAAAAASASRVSAVRKPRSLTGRNAPKTAGKAADKPKASDKPKPKVPKPPKEGPAPRNDDGSVRYPLKPNVLAGRLQALCAERDIEGAIDALKAAPAAAQNTPVWNTLMWECMKARKYGLAYKLYVDMKRRGFRPTIRTFATMLAGYARMPDHQWAANSKQLENVHALYASLAAHVDDLKQARTLDLPELAHLPLARASYIDVLGNSGMHHRLFDVFYALDQTGPLAADRVVFTALFKALATRRVDYASADARADTEGDGSREQGAGIGAAQTLLTPGAARAQNASDARLLWRLMLKTFEANTERGLGERYVLDGHLLAEALSVLAHGRLSDQTLALDLVREHLQLGPDAAAPTTSKAPLPPLLNTHTLNAALALCNAMRRYALTPALFKQAADREDAARAGNVHGPVSMLDRGHAEHVLRAHACVPRGAGPALETLRWTLRRAALGAPRLRPVAPTFALVLVAAWRSGDWKTACETWELMTGLRPAGFADGRNPGARGTVRANPDAEHASALAKAAVASRDAGNARMCLRMLEAVDVRGLLTTRRAKADEPADAAGDSRRAGFYGDKLADALRPLVELARRDGKATPEECRTWSKLAGAARASLIVPEDSGFEAPARPNPPRRAEKRVPASAASGV